MPADRHEPCVRPAYIAACELEVHDRLHVVGPVAMLRHAHAPDDDRVAGLPERLCEAVHIATSHARAPFETLPGQGAYFHFKVIPAGGPGSDEVAIEPALLDEMFARHRRTECRRRHGCERTHQPASCRTKRSLPPKESNTVPCLAR